VFFCCFNESGEATTDRASGGWKKSLPPGHGVYTFYLIDFICFPCCHPISGVVGKVDFDFRWNDRKKLNSKKNMNAADTLRERG
jgi:hypothetical protein